MPITTISPFPSRSAGLTQDAYSAAAEASLNTIKTAIDDINANASQYNVATTSTSVSSVLIGTGAKTFTVAAGLGYVVGMTVRIANSSANFMTGEVTSYSSTTLVVNVTSVSGSGTLASWTISMAAVGASTAATVSNTPSGNIAATTVQAAINELDSEKLSSAAGAVTDTNLSAVATGATTGDSASIPVITFTSKGRVTSVTIAPKITSGTTVATTSGTSVDFTSIPATAKRITIMLNSLSTSGSSIPIIQIGDSGGIENTGYLGAAATVVNGGSTAGTNATTGFAVTGSMASTVVLHVVATITLLDAATNLWICSVVGGRSDAANAICGGGTKALSATLDRIRLTTVGGTDTVDLGSMNILIE